MRLIIVDSRLIPGDGRPIQDGITVVVDDGVIADIVPRRYPYYDRADMILDARGHLVAPALIDHHAHGMAAGPLMGTAEPPLSLTRVRYNRQRLLDQGVTRVLDVDGFILPDEVSPPDSNVPVDVYLTTLHVPGFIGWASELQLGGLTARHRQTTVEAMLASGAVAVGEAGIGIDEHWVMYAILPRLLEEARGTEEGWFNRVAATSVAAAKILRTAPDRSRVVQLLVEHGFDEIPVDRCLELVEKARATRHLAKEALWAAARAAHDADVPLIAHHTPETTDVLLEIARELNVTMIAGHSNFRARSPEDAVARARALRERGVRIDIMTGDLFGLREFTSDPDVTLAMLAAGVVDLISTDYVGGFWDPMLRTLRFAVEEGVTDLASAYRVVAWNAVEALPRLGSDVGRVAPGACADLVVLDRERIDRVLAVVSRGRVAVDRLGT